MPRIVRMTPLDGYLAALLAFVERPQCHRSCQDGCAKDLWLEVQLGSTNIGEQGVGSGGRQAESRRPVRHVHASWLANSGDK
jgi:hypothetical protein